MKNERVQLACQAGGGFLVSPIATARAMRNQTAEMPSTRRILYGRHPRYGATNPATRAVAIIPHRTHRVLELVPFTMLSSSPLRLPGGDGSCFAMCLHPGRGRPSLGDCQVADPIAH